MVCMRCFMTYDAYAIVILYMKGFIRSNVTVVNVEYFTHDSMSVMFCARDFVDYSWHPERFWDGGDRIEFRLFDGLLWAEWDLQTREENREGESTNSLWRDSFVFTKPNLEGSQK